MKLTLKDYFFVGIQFLLFGFYLFKIKTIAIQIPYFISLTGLVISVTGLLILLLALLQLNSNLSPFPTPKSSAELIQTGLYKFIRHPIYTGIILLLFGYGIYRSSLFKILIALLLFILFYFKSSYEEKLLQTRYSNYSEFKKTRGRFFPKIFKN
jgi:protein-S-isoprenylcysteine O-methyltransferase Ste14